MYALTGQYVAPLAAFAAPCGGRHRSSPEPVAAFLASTPSGLSKSRTNAFSGNTRGRRSCPLFRDTVHPDFFRLPPPRTFRFKQPRPAVLAVRATHSYGGDSNGDRPAGARAQRPSAAVKWMKLAGCDVCIPRACLRRRRSVSDTSATPTPAAIVHFVGGFVTGQAPRSAYGRFIESVAQRACVVIVATPFQSLGAVADPGSGSEFQSELDSTRVNLAEFDPALFFDHGKLAANLMGRFQDAAAAARRVLEVDAAPPEVGMGHSLGAKLIAIMSALPLRTGAVHRRRPHGNVFISFNNYSVSQSIPFFREVAGTLDGIAGSDGWRQVQGFLRDALAPSGDATPRSGDSGPVPPFAQEWMARATGSGGWFDSAMSMLSSLAQREFVPSPPQLRDWIEKYYACERNLLIQFEDDSIDESDVLAAAILYRFPRMDGVLEFRQLPGTHLTPVAGDIREQILSNMPFMAQSPSRRPTGDIASDALRRDEVRDRARRRHRGEEHPAQAVDHEMETLVATVCDYLRRLT